jgi:hypothetical protein
MAKVRFLFQINGISVKNFTQGMNAVSPIGLWFLLKIMIFNDLKYYPSKTRLL